MEIEVIKSERRIKTVSARVIDDVLVVRAPAHLPQNDLNPIIKKLKHRFEKQKIQKTLDDKVLEKCANALNKRYFGGKLKWQSIRWVTNQNTLHGSCTPVNGTIRISHRLNNMPNFVRDYVIMHELAHLKEANHGKQFWKLVNRYPQTERARGYLMAVGLEKLEDGEGA